MDFKIQSESKGSSIPIKSLKSSNQKYLIQEDPSIGQNVPERGFEVEEKESDNDSDDGSVEELLPSTMSKQHPVQQVQQKVQQQQPVQMPKESPNKLPPPRPKYQFGGFDDYMNPENARLPPKQTEYSEGGDGDDDDDDQSQALSESATEYSDESRRSRSSRRSSASQKRKQKNKVKELLNELKELEDRGYKLYNEYNMRSNPSELEHEVKLGNLYFSQMSMQHFMEDGLFTSMSILEKGTKRWNPLGLQLDGLTNALVIQKDSISYEIRRFVKKWVGEDGEAWPPEVTLLGIIVVSIVTTHFTNMAKNEFTNPGSTMMSGVMSAMGLDGLFGGGGNNNNNNNAVNSIVPSNIPLPPQPGPLPQQQQAQLDQVQQQQQGNKMSPPHTSSDVSNLLQRLMPQSVSQNRNVNIPNNFDVLPPPVSTRPDHQVPMSEQGKDKDADRFSELSSMMSDDSGSTKNFPSRRRRRTPGKKSIDIDF